LQPAQARQRQQTQQRRGSNASRQKIPPPEMSRPSREIMLTIAKIPDILQKQPFKVHSPANFGVFPIG
jgi:hypothetical protein